MADLEGAGEATLNRLKELVEQIEEAHQKFTSLSSNISDVASRVQDHWARLGEQVTSFLEAVGEQQGRLSTEVREAGQALSDLGGAVADAQGEAEGELAGERQGVAAFADQVTADEPTVISLSESVESAFHTLSQQAARVQGQLDETLESARDFLQDQVVGDLQAMQEAIRERGDAVAEALSECEETLRESYDDW